MNLLHQKKARSFISILLSIILLTGTIIPGLAFAKSIYPCDGMTIDSVNLRQSARTSSSLLKTLPAGTVVNLLGTNGSFYKVEYGDLTGYLMKDYVQIGTDPTPTPEPPRYATLSQGSTGDAVTALQEALTELSFYNEKIDGDYGRSTFYAVANFQLKNNLDGDGIADNETHILLFEDKPLNSRGKTQAVNTLPAISGLTIELNNSGVQVLKLNKRLVELGYLELDEDEEVGNVCTKATLSAVKKFKKSNGLKNNSIVDEATQNLLYSLIALPTGVTPTPKPTPTPAKPIATVRAGTMGVGTKNVQLMLQALGYYTGKIDGVFGSSSVEALKEFQTRNGLEADGVCGTNTIDKMYSLSAIPAEGMITPAPIVSDSTDASGNTIKSIMYETYPPVYKETLIKSTKGTNGKEVQFLQKRLSELGYFSNEIDGNFDDELEQALKEFQASNALTSDGVAGYETQLILYSGLAVGPSNSEAGNTPAPIVISLRYGDVNDSVSKMQSKLIELGYMTGIADGVFGMTTKKALIEFQRANNLQRDGIGGALTLETLYSGTASAFQKVEPEYNLLKQGDSNTAVKELQSSLIELGYLDATADGVFGVKTYLALVDFQTRNGLTSDGIAGTETLNILGSDSVKLAQGADPTPKPSAPSVGTIVKASQVKYAYWYTEVRSVVRKYPNVTLYDYSSGISWQAAIFSTGAHADAEPITAADTANMQKAFGGETTWTAKPVWVILSNGTVYLASTHDVPHSVNHNTLNNFDGHFCIHFPRTQAQVEAIGPYATSHQVAEELGWKQTQQLVTLGK